MISDFRNYGSDMTYVNLVFPIGWSIHGIVYLTGLFLLIPLIHLKLDWINFGTVKILYMILEHSCREPEVVVKCCLGNLSNLVYCKVISRCGIKVSACARKLRLRLRLVGFLATGIWQHSSYWYLQIPHVMATVGCE